MRARHWFSDVNNRRIRKAFGVAVAGVLMAEIGLSASAAAVPPAEEPAVAQPTAGATELQAPDKVSAATIARLQKQPVEVIGERTETSSTWALPDGTFASSMAVGPVWVRRGAGDGTQAEDWAAVDLTLEKAADGSIRPKAHPADLVLAGAGAPSDGFLLSLERDGESIGIAWDGDLPEPRLEGPRAIYPEIEPGVDLVIEATRTGYEQFFVLTERPEKGAAPELDLIIEADGLLVEEVADGAVQFVDDRGDVAVQSGTPSAWDAAVDAERLHPLTEPWAAKAATGPALAAPNAEGEWPTGDPQPVPDSQLDEPNATVPSSATDNSALEDLGQAGSEDAADAKASPVLPLEAAAEVTAPNTVEFALTPAEAFLQDGDTEYPVVIDPEGQLGTWFDTWVQTGVSSDQSGSQELRIGTYNSGGNVARSFLSIDMSRLKQKQILEADLLLYNWYSWSCTSRGWEVWSTGTANSATRSNDQPAWFDRWGYSTQTRGYNSSCGEGWVGADITDLVQTWSSNSRGIVGMGLKANNEADNLGWKKFVSGNAAAYYTPHINIRYNTPPGTATNLIADGSPWGWTSSLTPELEAVAHDPDPQARVDMEFSIYNMDGSRLTTLTAENVMNGVAGSVRVPSGKLHNDTKYSLVVRSHDGASANAVNAGPWYFTVDTVAPLAPQVASTEYPSDGDWHGAPGTPGTFTFDLIPADSTISRFECFLDDDPAATKSAKAYGNHVGSVVIDPPKQGRNVLTVTAVDKAGQRSTPVDYIFYVGTGGLTWPRDGSTVVRRVRLVPAAPDTLTHVRFQWRRGPDLTAAEHIHPMAEPLLTNASGVVVAEEWTAIAALGGYATWDAGLTLGSVSGPVQVRAVLASNASGSDETPGPWVTVNVDPDADNAAGDAVGPGQVNLLTGDYSLSAIDADIAGLQVARTASSRDPRAGLEEQTELLTESQQEMSALTDITGMHATVAKATTRWREGGTSLRIIPDGSSTDSYAFLGDSGDIGLHAGRSYRASGWLHVPSATGLSMANPHGARLTAWAVLDGQTSPTFLGESNAPSKTGMFQQLTIDFDVPANAEEAFVRLYNGSDDVADVVYWDDVSVTEVWAPLGPEWTLGTSNEIASSPFSFITEPEDHVAALHLTSGDRIWFTSTGDDSVWYSQRGAEALTLSKLDGNSWRIVDLSGNTSTFRRQQTKAKRFPLVITSTVADSSGARQIYAVDEAGRLRLERLVAAPEPGVDGAPGNPEACASETLAVGCRALEFVYSDETSATGGTFGAYVGRLRTVRFLASEDGAPVSGVPVARYAYDASGRLRDVFDPRIDPVLKTAYDYDSDGRIIELTPPGELPWTFAYGAGGSSVAVGSGDLLDRSSGRLQTVSRASLVEGSESQAGPLQVSTLVYAVPLSRNGGGPYDMTASALASWGQVSAPTDATAIFDADTNPGLTTATPTNPGSNGYRRAVVHYLDSSGREVNTAVPPASAVAEVGYIQTTEYDEFGNAIRTLTASNRLLALTVAPLDPADSAALDRFDKLSELGLTGAGTSIRARALSSFSTYDDEGIRLLNSRGPIMSRVVRGSPTNPRRVHEVRSYVYDEGRPDGAAYNLVTTQTNAVVAAETDGAELLEETVIRNSYDPVDGASSTGPTSGWVLGRATSVTMDVGAGGANLTASRRYDEAGRTIEVRQVGADGSDARTLLASYFSAQPQAANPQCGNQPAWAGLPCETSSAGEATGHDAAEMSALLPVKAVLDYGIYQNVEVFRESATGPLAGVTVTQSRTVFNEFDDAGRQISARSATSGAGVTETPLPIVKTVYDPVTGAPAEVSAVDPGDGTTALETVRKSFDQLGRLIRYEDGRGAWTSYSYTDEGSLSAREDSLGSTREWFYNLSDEPRGFPTSVSDSVAGDFAATYGADGELLQQILPGGIELELDYDSSGAAVGRVYTRISDDERLAYSVITENTHSQWISHTTDSIDRQYAYDRAGRLTDVWDGVRATGDCAARRYTYDERSARTSIASAIVDVEDCSELDAATLPGADAVQYAYDSADRIVSDDRGGNWAYDPLGRVIKAPIPSPTLMEATNSYYANNRLASRTIAGIAKQSWTLDAALRVASTRQFTWTGGTWQAGMTSINHYDSDSDSPAWVVEEASNPSAVTRYVPGMEGGLALQTSATGDRVVYLTDLHGDVMARVPIPDNSPEAYWPGMTSHAADEFGNPVDPNTGMRTSSDGNPPEPGDRYGWLGGKQRSAQTVGGVVLMGARVYDPYVGRFYSPDSRPGGNASPYDYCVGDPVNCSDLSGFYPWDGVSHGPTVGPPNPHSYPVPRSIKYSQVNTPAPAPPKYLTNGHTVKENIQRLYKLTSISRKALAIADGYSADCNWSMSFGLFVCTGATGGYAGIGTTIGAVFITGKSSVDDRLLHHESIHADQWALYDDSFIELYLQAELMVIFGEMQYNPYEMEAGLEDGCYRPDPGEVRNRSGCSPR
jgi:RHS repeat-associated protein